jgi:oligopeptide transport system substrate-binding protein
MKHIKFYFSLLLIPATLLQLSFNRANYSEQEKGVAVVDSTQPITLNINLGQEPTTIDPSKTNDTTSGSVVDQLFLGLVILDDQTAEVKPQAALNWTVSPDGLTYTFNLRNDIFWSDGSPVTASDFRYGILRSLNPSTQADGAYNLWVIKNAAGYNSGSITDPNQVGVVVLDNTHISITLEQPAVYILSILSLWVARAMPQSSIATWGDTWTEPNHIVTNGPYRLSEWNHNDHISLVKNSSYYDASNVQIQQIRMRMVDDNSAWTMYKAGQLDTAKVPFSAQLDPITQQEIEIQPTPCTYYYGFSISQPPFNNPLVRKAIVASIDRQGLINSLLPGGNSPALTFVSPGMYGYVDGTKNGVGIPYNPNQARQWLNAAGFPGGVGLPPITIWFNTSSAHQAIAEYIRNNISDTLGINVAVQSMDWSDYLNTYMQGNLQIWRMGYCADFLDASNFLDYISYSTSAFGGWNNQTFQNVVAQADIEQDAVLRKSLFATAEKILVEDDAVLIPIYFYGSKVASHPYLERTYPAFTIGHIENWKITRISAIIQPQTGGQLTSSNGDTIIQLPAGVVTSTIELTQSPAFGVPPGANLVGIGHVFDISAVYSNTPKPAQVVAGQSYEITVHYAGNELGPAIENTLAIYYWDGSAWKKEPGSVMDMNAKTVSASPDHFSLFAVLGETNRVYLPLTIETY